MVSALSTPTWEDALREYVLHLTATRADKTVRYNHSQVRQLVKWADAEGVTLHEFGKRHMDRYVALRRAEGKSRMTLRHDGTCAKKFLAWCVKYEFTDKNRLAEYEVHNAPQPHKHMPTGDEMTSFFVAVRDYWSDQNPGVKFMPAPVRLFHRDRNTAIFMGLVDTACRVNEMLGLKVEDYQAKERQVTFRETKGKEPRTVPVSAEWAEAMGTWLRMRARLMQGVTDDEGWLFISDTGGRMDALSFLKTLQRVAKWAGLPKLRLHDFRRFSLNKLAQKNLLMAQAVAGHKDTKTTLIYTKLDASFVRREHEETGVLREVMGSRRPERRKRIV